MKLGRSANHKRLQAALISSNRNIVLQLAAELLHTRQLLHVPSKLYVMIAGVADFFLLPFQSQHWLVDLANKYSKSMVNVRELY
jgi:hypothetical protein